MIASCLPPWLCVDANVTASAAASAATTGDSNNSNVVALLRATFARGNGKAIIPLLSSLTHSPVHSFTPYSSPALIALCPHHAPPSAVLFGCLRRTLFHWTPLAAAAPVLRAKSTQCKIACFLDGLLVRSGCEDMRHKHMDVFSLSHFRAVSHCPHQHHQHQYISHHLERPTQRDRALRTQYVCHLTSRGPHTYAWRGGALLASSREEYNQYLVTRKEYEENGHAYCEERFPVT
ncbi:hypothetical protein Aperf_G00000026948 [Anoplocephala perfoliata]